ncbi:MAG: hypothetical protein Q8941_24455 [Bacteroidota bacterium]|nr:hypothetical protein [Bacteroidota bacterium]
MKGRLLKATAIVFPVILILISCSKSGNSPNTTYKVRYTVTGDSVTQFKISLFGNDVFLQTPFSGTRDTTIYVYFGADLRLDAKAVDSNLAASIYVNDVLKATGTDPDADGDGKTEVKIGYTISTP